jgi:hypothetical protein
MLEASMQKAILVAAITLGLAGIYDAVLNLPVVSGCDFYANCVDRR